MPIVVEYGADPQLMALAAAQGSGAAVAAEQDWRNQQLAEQQYQFDEQQNWRTQQAMLQDRLARYEMGNRTALGFANLQSNNYNNQLDYMLGQQQLAQRDEQLGVQAALAAEEQQQLTNRAQLSQLGQIARQQQQQRFQTMMAERKAFEDNLHLYSPRQQEQFRARLSEKYGIPYDAPEQAMGEEADMQQAAERQRMLEMLKAPDGSGEMMAPESVIDMLMPLPPEKRVDAWNKIHDTWTRRQKDLLASQANEIKQQEATANMQRDDERAIQQIQNTEAANKQKLQFAQEQHKQKMLMAAITNYQSARMKWVAAKSKAKDEGVAASLGEEPKLEDFLPPELQSQEPELEDALQFNDQQSKIITNPAGRRARLHPDGSVTPID